MLLQILIALDQLVHTLIGGKADETLSAAAWRWERDGKRSWPRKAIDTLFFWQEAHCYESYISEILRRHLPDEYSR